MVVVVGYSEVVVSSGLTVLIIRFFQIIDHFRRLSIVEDHVRPSISVAPSRHRRWRHTLRRSRRPGIKKSQINEPFQKALLFFN